MACLPSRQSTPVAGRISSSRCSQASPLSQVSKRYADLRISLILATPLLLQLGTSLLSTCPTTSATSARTSTTFSLSCELPLYTARTVVDIFLARPTSAVNGQVSLPLALCLDCVLCQRTGELWNLDASYAGQAQSSAQATGVDVSRACSIIDVLLTLPPSRATNTLTPMVQSGATLSSRLLPSLS